MLYQEEYQEKYPEECVGLVLQSTGCMLSLLSPQEGRVEKKWFKPPHRGQLYRGSFISYRNEKKRGQRVGTVEHLDIELCATRLAFQDIYLLHPILELCHYFIPVGSEAREPYYFLAELFQKIEVVATVHQKRIIVCKLFALLALYPDDSSTYMVAQRLREMPIDKLLDAPLELHSEELFIRWLLWCKEMHPKGSFFKALPLLYEK